MPALQVVGSCSLQTHADVFTFLETARRGKTERLDYRRL